MHTMAVRTHIFTTLAILILTALAYPASAYDIQDEDIWIFQGAYTLAAGERAELEGFTVKVYSVNMDEPEPSAIVLIYRNRDFKKSFLVDASANNEQVYDDELKIRISGIDSGAVSLETYKQKYERVWITSVPRKSMKAGDILEDGGYRVRVKEVGESGALVSVEGKGGVFEESYQSGNYRKFSEEFMIRVIYINPNTREVFIETFRPGAPALTIDVLTDKPVYNSNENISYMLTLTNSGTIPLHGIILSTSSSAGLVEEPQLQHASLDALKMKRFTVPVKAPVTPVSRNMLIRSQVTGYDYKGNAYSREASFEVQVRPYISVEKKVEAVRKSPKDTSMGTDGHFIITLKLRNTAGSRVAVNVLDELPPSMIPEDMERTEWAIVLDAGATKEIVYNVQPTEPGSFTFGPAVVQWNDSGETYSVESDPASEIFRIRGSKVVVEKRIDSAYLFTGEMSGISVTLINDGDSRTHVSLSDSVPDGISLLSGQPGWEGDLEAGASREISYIVKAEDAGSIRLPAAVAECTDEEGKKYSSASEALLIYIDDGLPTDNTQTGSTAGTEHTDGNTGRIPDQGNAELTRTKAAGFLLSAFITLLSLLAIIPGIMYLVIRGGYK